MSASPAKLQDMPPKGGYQNIPFARIPAKKYFKGWQMIAAYAGFTTAGLSMYYLNCKENQRNDVEMRSARNVIYALLLAERDREYLKQLKRNRDEEADLMKDVKGWQVGTWYGEPVFKTLPKDQFVDPSFQEFYVHSSYEDMAKRKDVKMMS
ncbi:AAEL005538-PA [Aedes aegypti]|uniref:NADH dehydrogenase [ubiquinone] 1 alpha subcomplex subunit 13 n=2 Tax=Aedes aegypti TaxID=7159 RepID=A6KVD3_AEDAE|nr:NADH dehydrogenase [ubiquinone] 1 alpha subcomplex subunit 13 [Aedes aegypti]XP_001651318.1 NADH dehydrogenase [ubiquinone] 1 alpha subcomplex subunit 13 [Aedes aegypti]EAT42790.1 AAEL005693-PB [Aedes aegypti]EAT42791.1 AAEL005693-PA [Aedes aegypti]EAT42966.1 AAEL005538-PA [Aedes aegypti]